MLKIMQRSKKKNQQQNSIYLNALCLFFIGGVFPEDVEMV